MASALNAHEAPPPYIKDIFKKYQKIKPTDIGTDDGIIDFRREEANNALRREPVISSFNICTSFETFQLQDGTAISEVPDAQVYSHENLPGLLIVPSLLPVTIQQSLLSRLIHRDLSDPRHQTNLHMHYGIPYPQPVLRENDRDVDKPESFFSYKPTSDIRFLPQNPEIHKPLTISQVMQKKLRWITLGGQYDWTNKVYPEGEPPVFPSDVSGLLEHLFPKMKAQAAIVNFYSAGDTLSLHRDVSEECDRGLVSVSIGCDCLFVIGLGDVAAVSRGSESTNKGSDCTVIRLRSGDIVYMSGRSRYAWHGVAKIIPNTCPEELKDWPAQDSGLYGNWKGWLSNKRVNLNVRQMRE